jgi:CheY-like chemotaxis protein
MIYIIDDKKLRQHDFGWGNEKFTQYASSIKPLYSIEDVVQIGEDLYNEKNIILYHESFLDFTNDNKKAIKQRMKLQSIAEAKANLSIAFFSGSQGSRSLNGNIAYMPVSTLYQNLEILVNEHVKGTSKLEHLLYGQNPRIEEELYTKLNQANRDIEADCAKVSGSNLFIRPTSNFIQYAIDGATEGKLFNDVSDEKFSEKITEWLGETEYDNIFLPLCFGPTLSDYNGLRLATHIRCTPTKNQLKRIFIYGFVGLDYLLEQEYFNILKSKNVKIVPYSKKAFSTAADTYYDSLEREELSKEIKKIKLDPPLNYADSHSIANEWAIYRWAISIKATDTCIESISKNVNIQIYFKYLQTVYPKSEAQLPTEDQLKINYSDTPKILYIDDDADKGWYEIFCNLLYDRNGLNFEHLDDEFNFKTQDQILNICIEKIKADDIDLVILDFRLHLNDFSAKNIEEVTGLKLLKLLKKWNPGIQVIIFSASNKAWNLLELQANGADGFLLKESPELSLNSSYTLDSITTFSKQMEYCLSYTYLKEVWNYFEEITKVFSKNPLTTKYFEKSLEEQLNGIKYQNLLLQELAAIFEILKTKNENRYNIAMIMLYKVLEYLNEIFYQKVAWDKPPLFYDNSPVDYFDKNSNALKKPTDRLDFYNRQKRTNEKIKIKPEWLKSTSNKILNLAVKKFMVTDNNILIELISLSDYRNDFIHSDSSKRNTLRVLQSKDILKWTYSITSMIKHL